MFTVKVRGADGVESLYSCEAVEVVGPGAGSPTDGSAGESPCGANGGRDMYSEGIFLDRDSVPLDPSDPGSPRGAKHIIQFGGEETESRKRRKGGRVWVMNEAGATVASYDL